MNTELRERAAQRVNEFHQLQELGLIAKDPLFFPAMQYPPITMYPPATQEELFRGYENPADGLFVVYAHFPFCKQFCSFCHYPNRVNASEGEKDQYIDTLAREMDNYLSLLGLEKIRARSILVGGGTPTLLSPIQLKRFLVEFDRRVDRSACSQFSYDVDPNTLLGPEGAERLRILRDHGVERVTIGMQSLVPEILIRMRRHHSVEEAIGSLEQARKFGMLVNIEFIFGYPGETLESWMHTMREAVALDPDEIQLYQLKVIPYGDRPGTILQQYQAREEEFLSMEDTLAMKEMAISYMREHGFLEDLHRVYTRDPTIYSHYADDQCCKLLDQIGFGTKTHHSLRDRFALNTDNYTGYYDAIWKGGLPIDRGMVRDADHQARFSFIMPLKNRHVTRDAFERCSGRNLDEVFVEVRKRLVRHGLLSETDQEIRLTDLGRFFTNEVCQQFYQPQYIPHPRTAYADGELTPYRDWETG